MYFTFIYWDNEILTLLCFINTWTRVSPHSVIFNVLNMTLYSKVWLLNGIYCIVIIIKNLINIHYVMWKSKGQCKIMSYADIGQHKLCQFHDERSVCWQRVLNVLSPYALCLQHTLTVKKSIGRSLAFSLRTLIVCRTNEKRAGSDGVIAYATYA